MLILTRRNPERRLGEPLHVGGPPAILFSRQARA